MASICEIRALKRSNNPHESASTNTAMVTASATVHRAAPLRAITGDAIFGGDAFEHLSDHNSDGVRAGGVRAVAPAWNPGVRERCISSEGWLDFAAPVLEYEATCVRQEIIKKTINR